MTLTSESLMWVMMVQHKTSDQYLTSGKVSTWSIHGFKRYCLLKTLSQNLNILCNANAAADAVVTAIALPVLSYRWAKNLFFTQKKQLKNNIMYFLKLFSGLEKWTSFMCKSFLKFSKFGFIHHNEVFRQTDQGKESRPWSDCSLSLIWVYTLCRSICIWAVTWQNQQNDCAQWRLRSAWAVFVVRMKKAWVLSYPLTAQWRLIRQGRMPRLIRVLAGRTLILLVLSCCSSSLVRITLW